MARLRLLGPLSEMVSVVNRRHELRSDVFVVIIGRATCMIGTLGLCRTSLISQSIVLWKLDRNHILGTERCCVRWSGHSPSCWSALPCCSWRNVRTAFQLANVRVIKIRLLTRQRCKHYPCSWDRLCALAESGDASFRGHHHCCLASGFEEMWLLGMMDYHALHPFPLLDQS